MSYLDVEYISIACWLPRVQEVGTLPDKEQGFTKYLVFHLAQTHRSNSYNINIIIASAKLLHKSVNLCNLGFLLNL